MTAKAYVAPSAKDIKDLTVSDIMNYGESSIESLNSLEKKASETKGKRDLRTLATTVEGHIKSLAITRSSIEKPPFFFWNRMHYLSKVYKAAQTPTAETEELVKAVDNAVKELSADSLAYDNIYDAQVKANEMLQNEIDSGTSKLAEYKEHVLPEIQIMLKSENALEQEKAARLMSIADAFEKRMADLVLSKQNGIIAAVRTRQIQKTCNEVCLALQSGIREAQKKWSEASTAIVFANNVEQGARALNMLADFTRDLERTASTKTKIAVIEGTKSARRLLFDSATITHSRKNVIETFDTVTKIHTEFKENLTNILENASKSEKELANSLENSRRALMNSLAASNTFSPATGIENKAYQSIAEHSASPARPPERVEQDLTMSF